MDIEPPEGFGWIYTVFIDLYNASDGVITPETVERYQTLFQIRLTLYEIQTIFRMKTWSDDEKAKLQQEG